MPASASAVNAIRARSAERHFGGSNPLVGANAVCNIMQAAFLFAPNLRPLFYSKLSELSVTYIDFAFKKGDNCFIIHLFIWGNLSECSS